MEDFKPGPNAENIRKHAMRVITGKIPSQVRAELRAAVGAGYLGHIKKDGLLPEIFFDPRHTGSAMERRKNEAVYAAECVSKVLGGA
jgi:peptide methionine sulfoxide reductase MsrB